MDKSIEKLREEIAELRKELIKDNNDYKVEYNYAHNEYQNNHDLIEELRLKILEERLHRNI